MQTPEEKLSLEEMKAHRDRELHNSNMLNLANVISNIDEQLEYIEKKKNRLTELKAEIESFAEKGDVRNTDEVMRFRDKVAGPEYMQRRR